MRKIILFLLLFIIVLATGCPKYKPNLTLDNKMADAIKAKYETEIARYDCLSGGYFYNGTNANGVHLCSDGNNGQVVSRNANGKADARRIRDNIIDKSVGAINQLYDDFIIDLQTHRSRTNVLADLTELGLGTSIGITKGERPLRILGVLLTAFKGGRRSVDLNFYYEQTTPILIAKMDGVRDPILQRILEKKELDVDQYALSQVEEDLVDLFVAGTLVRAFTELNKDTSAQAQQARQSLLRVKNAPITPIPTASLAGLNKKIGDKLEELEDEFFSGDQTLKDAAMLKMKDALNSLTNNAKANLVINSTLNGAGVADIASLDDDLLIPTLDSVFQLAVDDEDISKAIADALKIKP